MRKLIYLVALVLGGVVLPRTSAQENAKSTFPPKVATTKDSKAETENAVVPLKVTVVFNEYEGEKKVSSLPYTLFLKAAEEHKDYFGRVRMGVRVPIWTGGKDSAIQYQDVGSNIDCEARAEQEGRYLLDLMVERSSIYTNKEEHSSEQRSDEQPHQPLLRTFRANLALMLRDGQTTQATLATDPLNGHIVKVDVTLNVVK
jgi:hypothetical protein